MTTRLAVIEIVVADMAASLAFYRRLGIDVPADADDQPHVVADLPGGLKLAWDTIETIRSFDPDWSPPQGDHKLALAFACDDPADVDRSYQQLMDAGYASRKEPWDAFWGMRYAIVYDPDGNAVDLCAPLPATADQPA